MLLWVLLVLVHQLSCEMNSGEDDAHIQSLLQMLLDESTFSSTPTIPSTTRIVPYFETSTTSTNLTAELGSSVVFHCHVNDLVDDTTVSWLRRRDGQLQLLSVGVEVYSSDGRFTASLVAPNDWQLHLLSAQDRDRGLYECQVSSHPPIVHTVHLHVEVPELRIVDERGLPVKNKFYKAGSTLELQCVISRVSEPSDHIVWRRGPRVLHYDGARGGISIKTVVTAAGVFSHLFISNARAPDSGDYSCSLADLSSANVTLHVLDGETPAAMQHGSSPSVRPPFPVMSAVIIAIMVIHLHYR